jgi:hypothetical protein
MKKKVHFAIKKFIAYFGSIIFAFGLAQACPFVGRFDYEKLPYRMYIKCSGKI